MPTVLRTPGDSGLSEVVRVLRDWQHDGAPVQLHPGDLGWHWRFGAEATAAAVRTWIRAGQILAVGLIDGPRLVRLAVAPDADQDEELARRVVADVTRPKCGVLPPGPAYVEARRGRLLRDLLVETGWEPDEPWTPLCRDLSDPVAGCGLRIEVTGADQARARVAVQRAAFENSTFTTACWQVMAAGPAYADARCLVGYDERDIAVAAVTVWSAGPGRPGLLEPMGVHREHRGRGYGTQITVAAAAALREMGASSATVCTASAKVGAVATYRSAGFRPLPEVRDLGRVSGG